MRRPWEKRRRLLRWGLAGLLGFLAVGALGVYIAYPRIAAWKIRDKLTVTLEQRLGREVEVGTVDVDRGGTAVVHDLVIKGAADTEPLVRIERVVVTYDFWASVTGDVRLDRIEVHGVHVRALRGADGGDNFSDLVDRFRGGSETGSTGGRARGPRPKSLAVMSGDVVMNDLASGASLRVGSMSMTAEPHGELVLTLGDIDAATGVGPAARLGTLVVTAETDRLRATARATVAGGAASLWPGMSLTGIAGTLAEGSAPGRLELDLSGGYGGAEGTLWSADGWIDPDTQTGSVAMTADRFTLDRIAAVLEGSSVIDYDDTSIDARLQIDVSAGVARIAGDFHVNDLTVFHPLLAEKPVRDITIAGPIEAVYHRRARRLEIARAELESRGVRYNLTGFAAMPGGELEAGARRPAWHVGGRLEIPKLPCQTMLDGIPAELVPYITGAKLRGNFYTDLSVDIDFADLQATQLVGAVGIRGCKVKEMTEAADAKRLLEPFTHYVQLGEGEEQWIAFEVGPDNPDFVPIHEVSPFLIKSLMTTEDSRFYRHRGFITSEFRTALIKNLEAGYFRYGASSITMQTVKNVMLYSEKTLARKLQELFLTWYIEQELDKDRIMEIYLNAIEYGPGLYGIGPAARRYFGKHPMDLNPVETAFFSSILPNPKDRYRQYCAAKLWRRTEAKMQRILKIMLKRERLTPEEYEVAAVTPLVFSRDEALPERECLKMVDEFKKNAKPTNPLKK